jgi:hypothetical protein
MKAENMLFAIYDFRLSDLRFFFFSVYLRLFKLKKQSQFIEGQISVNSIVKGAYGKIPLLGAQKTKSNKTNII